MYHFIDEDEDREVSFCEFAKYLTYIGFDPDFAKRKTERSLAWNDVRRLTHKWHPKEKYGLKNLNIKL